MLHAPSTCYIRTTREIVHNCRQRQEIWKLKAKSERMRLKLKKQTNYGQLIKKAIGPLF